MRVLFTLSIGYPGARQEEIIDIDDDDFADCDTDEHRKELLNDYWKDWSSNFIDGGVEIIEDT